MGVNYHEMNLLGINRQIWTSVMRNVDFFAGYDLGDVNGEAFAFLTEGKFRRRRKIALAISDKSLRRHGKSGAFEPFLSRLMNIETGVQRFDPNLRDHVNHSVYVYFLGLLIMKEIRQVHRIDPLSWKIAALLHDVGYPLQLFQGSIKNYVELFQEHKLKIAGFNKRVECHVSMDGFENLEFCDLEAFEIIENQLRNQGISLDIKSIWDEQLEQGVLNHGILSALITINMIDALYEKNNPEHAKQKIIDEIDWGLDCFETQVLPAVSAISVHDILDRIESISLESSPVAYLLVLSDVLQQWNRYQPGKRVCSPSSVFLEFHDYQIFCELKIPKKRMKETVVLRKLFSHTWSINVKYIPKSGMLPEFR